MAFAEGRLRAEELSRAHEHLDHCEPCQELLSEAVHAAALAATHLSDEPGAGEWNTTFQPGALIGQRYVVRRFVARGGMGEVYEAFDQELQECVALKTVTSTACDSPRAVRWLKAEVQLARRVSHANVCRIYDFGTHTIEGSGAQIHFLTMEFVEGETLGQRVRFAGALPLTEAKEIARQLLLGLSAAHAAGILHRDFKSDNVLLRSSLDGGVTPVIVDFGLARAVDPRARSAPTGSSQLVAGTFGYMAPEQIQGRASVASDVYSFGVVCFEMLTGELPFDVERSASAARATPPSERTRNASSIASALPPAFATVVSRCLRPDPVDRYASADAALTALDAAFRRSGPRRQFTRFAAFTLVGALAGLGVSLALLVGRPAHGSDPHLSVNPALPTNSTLVSAKGPAASAPSSSAGPSPEHAASEATRALNAPAPPAPKKREPFARARGDASLPNAGRAVLAAAAVPSPAASTVTSVAPSEPQSVVVPVAPTAVAPAAPAPAPPAHSATPKPRAPDSSNPDWVDPFGAAPTNALAISRRPT